MDKVEARKPAFPAFGIGSGTLANAEGEKTFLQVVEHAWRRGVRYFDTSAFYLGGESERRLGSALAAYPQDQIKLSTKVGRYQNHTGSSIDPQSRNSFFDYSGDATMASVDRSLKRLGVDRLDAVYIHDLDHRLCGAAYPELFRHALRGAYPALMRLKEQGIVGEVGVAAMDWRACHEFAMAVDIDIVMPAGEYSLLKNDCAPLLAQCRDQGIAWIAASPFNSGILATGPTAEAFYDMRPASSQVLQQVSALDALCRRHDVPLPAAALQYPMRNPAVSTVVAGAKSPRELDDIIVMSQITLPGDFWIELESFVQRTIAWERS